MSRAGALAALCLWLSSAAGYAQQPGPAAAASTHSAADDEAKAAFDAGQKRYEQGEYGLAAQAFREAYQRSPQPVLLYNLAQAERLDGQCEPALEHYQEFVASFSGAVPADVNDKIAEMKQCVARAKTPVASPAAATPANGDQASPAITVMAGKNRGAVHPRNERAQSGLPQWLGWTAAAVGAAAIAAGAVMGAMAVHRQSIVEDTCPAKRCRDQSGITAANEGKKLVIGTVAAFGLGAAAGGLAIYVWAEHPASDRADWPAASSLRPSAIVAWSGMF
jgi:tetratricopeptide (TPR) repeat protein